jgi:hypothetical protein
VVSGLGNGVVQSHNNWATHEGNGRADSSIQRTCKMMNIRHSQGVGGGVGAGTKTSSPQRNAIPPTITARMCSA